MLIGKLQGVCSSITLFDSSNDECGEVFCGINVESTTAILTRQFLSWAGPLYVRDGLSRESTGNSKDLPCFNADFLREGLNSGCWTWKILDYNIVRKVASGKPHLTGENDFGFLTLSTVHHSSHGGSLCMWVTWHWLDTAWTHGVNGLRCHWGHAWLRHSFELHFSQAGTAKWGLLDRTLHVDRFGGESRTFFHDHHFRWLMEAMGHDLRGLYRF